MSVYSGWGKSKKQTKSSVFGLSSKRFVPDEDDSERGNAAWDVVPEEQSVMRRSAQRASPAPRTNPFEHRDSPSTDPFGSIDPFGGNSDPDTPKIRDAEVVVPRVNPFSVHSTPSAPRSPVLGYKQAISQRSGSEVFAELLNVRRAEDGLKLTALQLLKLHKLIYPNASDEERVAALKKYHQ